LLVMAAVSPRLGFGPKFPKSTVESGDAPHVSHFLFGGSTADFTTFCPIRSWMLCKYELINLWPSQDLKVVASLHRNSSFKRLLPPVQFQGTKSLSLAYPGNSVHLAILNLGRSHPRNTKEACLPPRHLPLLLPHEAENGVQRLEDSIPPKDGCPRSE
jgi:hypothetical protein